MNRQVELASERFAKEMEKYPVEVRVGVGIVLPNLINGCTWGFVSGTNQDYIKCLDSIAANPNMSSYKVKGGYLYNINMDYLLKILNSVVGGLVTQKDLQLASQHRQKALADLEKFMRKGGQGRIGIYNLNDSPRITVNGETFRAFCVTMNDLLAICVRNGYKLNLGGALRTPGQVSAHASQVIEKLVVAPSGNALFIDITK